MLASIDAADALAQAQELLGITLGDYLASRPPSTVVTVSDAMPLEQALKIFAVRNILSAPVFAAGSSRCLGFVGVDDITRAVLGWADVGADPSPSGRAEGLRRAGERLARERVRDIARANDGELLFRASECCTLLQVVRDGFLRGGRGPPCHRVAVYDYEGVEDDESGGDGLWGDSGGPGAGAGGPGGGRRLGEGGRSAAGSPRSGAVDPTEIRILAIVSQSDVISYLARHADRLGPLAGVPVGDAGVASSPVAAVPDSMPAALAFASMFERGAPVSSAAVLASRGPQAGTLVANVSVSDLRGMRPDGLAALAAPVLAYLRTRPGAAAGRQAPAAAWGVRPADEAVDVRPVSVPPGAPLGDVLRLLEAGRHHRVYVCDAAGRPDGIVTLTDLLRLFARGGDGGGGGEEG